MDWATDCLASVARIMPDQRLEEAILETTAELLTCHYKSRQSYELALSAFLAERARRADVHTKTVPT